MWMYAHGTEASRIAHYGSNMYSTVPHKASLLTRKSMPPTNDEHACVHVYYNIELKDSSVFT